MYIINEKLKNHFQIVLNILILTHESYQKLPPNLKIGALLPP